MYTRKQALELVGPAGRFGVGTGDLGHGPQPVQDAAGEADLLRVAVPFPGLFIPRAMPPPVFVRGRSRICTMLVNPSASGVAEVLCPPVGQGPDLLWILSQPVPKNPHDVARRFDGHAGYRAVRRLQRDDRGADNRLDRGHVDEADSQARREGCTDRVDHLGRDRAHDHVARGYHPGIRRSGPHGAHWGTFE